mgnify:CR=1 FL=1
MPKHKILVEGEWYEVTEDLGFVHHRDGAGPVKFVQTPEGERVAVKNGTTWRFAKPTIHPRGPIAGQ